MFILTNIAIVLFITTALNAAGTFVAWGRRKSQTGLYFALGMMGLTFWTLAAGLGYAAVPLELKILFAKFDAIGYHSALVLLLICVMYFAGLGEWAERKWLRVILFLLPGLSILLISTNELHGWVWQRFTPVGNNVVVFEHGPGFTLVAITGYLLITSILGILVAVSRKGSDIQKQQARLLLFASVFPLVANVVYLYGVEGAEGVDWSSVTFSVAGLVVLLALRFARFTDIIPIARDQLVISLGDGMIVVDAENRIIDLNPAAEKHFSRRSSSLIGTSLKEIVPPNLYALLESSAGQEVRTEVEFGAEDKRYSDVLISPIQNQKQNAALGRLILFRDITERKNNELRLLQLTQAVEQSPASVVITDTNGIITFVNPFFTMLTGYAPSEAIGKNPKIVQSGQTPDEIYQDMWQTILSGHVWNGEFLNKKKNGELYWVSAIMAPVLDSDGNLQSFITIQEDITIRKLGEQALESRFLEIQNLNKDLQEAQTQIMEQQRTLATLAERQRLGRNLHDSVNQSIHSLMLFSETLIALLKNGEVEQAIHAAERIHESGEQALKEVRVLVHEGQEAFMGGYDDLILAVEKRLNMVERRAGIQADFSYDLSAIEGSTAEWMENIYWIILEGLNNSMKHSQASRVHVRIVDHVNQITVEVNDNGAGFDPGQAGGGGFGMKSMQERAEILGGVLSVESSPGHGTRVKCTLEIPRK